MVSFSAKQYNRLPTKDREELLREIRRFNFETGNVVFDFSFEGAFVSCKHGSFDNFLHDEAEFAAKFACAEKNIIKLSAFTPKELITNRGFRHCHKVGEEKEPVEIIRKISKTLMKPEEYAEQIVGGDEIYQLGYENQVRFIGIFEGNIFRVLFVDYHHDLYPDEHRNTRPRQNNTFSLITVADGQ